MANIAGVMANIAIVAFLVFVVVFFYWSLVGGANGGYRKAPKAAYGRALAPADHSAGANATSAATGSNAGSGIYTISTYANPYANARQSPMMMAQMQQMHALQQQQNALGQLAQSSRILRLAQPALLPKIEDAGIRLGEIEAWRAWRYCAGWFVRSVHRDDVWAPGEAMTGKPATGHGVYAWPTMSAALTYGMGQGSPTMVIGRVHLWGEVVEHERGYRAQYAKIIAFDAIIARDATTGKIDGWLKVLRERYKLSEPV